MVSEHSFPNFAKSADRIDGAMIAGGDILIIKSILGRERYVGNEVKFFKKSSVKMQILF